MTDNRFVAQAETGPHTRGKSERWAVYERIMDGAGLALRYRAAHRQDAEREAVRLNTTLHPKGSRSRWGYE